MSEDGHERGVQRKLVGGMGNKVLELTKLKEKWEEDCNAWAGNEIKNGELNEILSISELRNKNSKLANDKCKVVISVKSLNTKFRVSHERAARLEDDSKLLMNVNASGEENNEWEPSADPMVAESEEKDDEDVCHNKFLNDIVEEAGPLQRNGDTASTRPQNKRSKEASSVFEVKGASSASGRLKMEKHIEIMNFDYEDDNQCTSRGVHEKKAISGIAGKYEHPTPSSSKAVQQMSKFANEVDKIKRKYSLTCNESFTSTSSDDLL